MIKSEDLFPTAKADAMTEATVAVSRLHEGRTEAPVAVSRPQVISMQNGLTEIAQAIPKPIPKIVKVSDEAAK